MLPNIWSRFGQRITIWFVGALPGIAAVGIIIFLRLSGSLQFLEWVTFDFLLHIRPVEPIDERVVIVGINEEDIQHKKYPISDREIAQLLRTLQKYQPRVIGLDIVRDVPVEPGHGEVVTAFKEINNLIAVEKVLPDRIKPPPYLPPEQIGFIDALSDNDGKFRRAILGVNRPEDKTKYVFSLPLRLAETYLKAEGLELDNGLRDRQAMRFGSTELPRFLPNSGGYVGADDFGVQVLLNYRNGRHRFRTLSLRDIINTEAAQKGNSQVLRDAFSGRIVLIGVTAPSIKDFMNTSAIASLQPPGKIYGVEFHAHVVSQIVSAVLDGRPVLQTWLQGWEYLWIVGWGILAIYLGQLTQSPAKNLVYVAAASLSLVGISYAFILWGWWIPLATPLSALIINGAILSAFYQYNRFMRLQIELRQRTIEQTFVEIHNGPLQTLANILRHVQDRDLEQNRLLEELQNLNYEIREVGEHLKLEALEREESLRLGSGLILDLKLPMRNLFYEVYSHTLQRDFPCFATLKVKAYCFAPIEKHYLSNEQKRELCQFLEEALCNVGKHAQGVTRLNATGKQKAGWYTLSIKDNGTSIHSGSKGRGTKQCLNLAKKLGGKFQRQPLLEKGTVCELTWPIAGKYWGFVQIGRKCKTLVIKGLHLKS